MPSIDYSSIDSLIDSAVEQEDWAAYSQKIKDAFREFETQIKAQLRVSFSTGNINGVCPSGGGPLTVGTGAEGRIE